MWRPLREVTVPGSTWNPRTDPRSSICYVDVSAVSREELRIVSETKYSAANAPSRARKVVKTGDTIFATVRPTLRRIAQIPASLDGEIVSTAFSVLRANPAAIHPDFLYFAMQLDGVADGIAAMQTGASYPAVRDTDVLNQVIPLPPLSDQCEIATALKLVRSAVLSQKRCEEAAMNLKRAAMETLFTRGLRGEEQKKTAIGLVPEGWELKPISDHYLPIAVPKDKDSQREIVSILDAVDRKTDLHRRKRAVLDDLFKVLLKKLMTGKICIADLDVSALRLDCDSSPKLGGTDGE